MPRGGNHGGGRPNRSGVNWQQSAADARRQLRRMRGMPPQARPVTINGVTYPSRAAASRALNVTEHRIRAWVAQYGDTFPIDDMASYQPRCRAVTAGLPAQTRGRPRSVTIDGVRYQSMAEAARALGVTRQAISLRARKTKRCS